MGKQRKRKETRGTTAPAPPASPPQAVASQAPAPALPWPLWVYAALLLVATTVAYLPAFNAGFVRWDDQYYVEESPLLEDPEALQKIWNPFTHDTQQYYPLVFSTYWLEYQLWGLDPRGYHIVNVAVHAANVLLVLLVAVELGLTRPVAAVAAAIFAVHPVQVASVAWISELKNTLSGAFYLLAMLAYVRHRRSGSWATYAWCLLAFVGALLSKTQTLTLPASLFLADWALQRLRRLPRLSLPTVALRGVPMLALGVVAGLITMNYEQKPWTREFSVVERALTATNAAVFYARTFFVPVRLSPIYPEWHVDSGDWQWWLAPTLCVAVAAAMLVWRRRIPVLVAWGVAHFYIILVPVLGLFSFNFQTYTLVADHFPYLSLLGGGVAVAITADRVLQGRARALRPQVVAGLALLLLAATVANTYAETTHWRSNLTFWTRVRDRDPNGFLGNFNLGNHYRNAGQWAEAVPFYRRAAEIRSRVDYPFLRYIDALERAHGPQAVIDACTEKLARDARFYHAYVERAARRERLGQTAEALQDYRRTLQFAPRNSAAWSTAQRGKARLESAE